VSGFLIVLDVAIIGRNIDRHHGQPTGTGDPSGNQMDKSKVPPRYAWESTSSLYVVVVKPISAATEHVSNAMFPHLFE